MTFKGSQIGSLASALLVTIVLGSLYTFAAISPYISSYLYYHGGTASSTAFSLVFALIIVLEAIGIPIEAFISNYLSNRIICLISVIGLSASIFCASFMTTFAGMIVFMGILNGIFIGFGYLPPIKNAYQHLPHRKGLCAGVCLSGFGFGTIIFNYLIIALINPDNAEVDHNTKRFPRQVADRVPLALKIFAAGVFLLGVIGSLFLVPPKKKPQTLYIASKLMKSHIQESKIQEENQESKLPILKQFINKKGQILTLHLLTTCSFGILISSNYKQIAFQLNQQFQKEDHLITVVGSIGSLANGLSRAIWGILFDKFSFKVLSIAINSILLLGAGTLIFAADNIFSYGAMVTLIYFCYGGSFAIFPTQTVRVFGQPIGPKIYSLVFIGAALASVLQFIIHYFVVEEFKNKADGYFYCFIVFVGIQGIGLLLSIFVRYEYTCLQENLLNVKETDKISDDDQQTESSKQITYLSAANNQPFLK